MMPVDSNELLIRFPREFMELFRRCPPLPLVFSDPPFPSAAIAPPLSSLFLSIFGVSSDGRGTRLSVIFSFPFLEPGSGGRAGNWNSGFMVEDRAGFMVVWAREFRLKWSASSSMARTSCSISRSSWVEEGTSRSRLRVEDLGFEGGCESALNFLDGCLDGPAPAEDGGRCD
jgi:hypothetical protein